MKKYLFILLLALGAAQTLQAGNVNAIFREFKEESKAEYVSIPSFVMKLGKMFADKDDAEDKLASKISSVKMLDLEDCNPDVKARFRKRLANLKDEEYETLMRVNDDGDKVRILMKQKKDTVKELLIVCEGDEDCALILLKGDFRLEDIDGLVEQETDKRHGGE